jgi:hypothetical protein
MEHFYDLVSNAASSYNMELLPSLWDMSLSASFQSEGTTSSAVVTPSEIIRAMITAKIPSIARFYGIPERDTFPEFTRIYQAYKLEKEFGIERALVLLVEQNNLAGILYLVDKYPETDYWSDLCMIALITDNNGLAKFFYERISKEEKERSIQGHMEYHQHGPSKILKLVETAVERGNNEMIFFFLDRIEDDGFALGHIFLKAVRNNDFNLINRILDSYNLPYWAIGQSAAIALDENHLEMARYLLTRGADVETFIGASLYRNYDRDLVIEYIDDLTGDIIHQFVLPEIEGSHDYDLIDLIAERRPDLLAVLKQYTADEGVRDYLERY